MTRRILRYAQMGSYALFLPPASLCAANAKYTLGLATSMRLGRKLRDGIVKTRGLRQGLVLEAQDLERIAGYWAQVLPWDACLEIALATSLWLALFGERPELVISNAGGSGPWHLHAWLQLAQTPLFLGTASTEPVFTWNWEKAKR